MTKYNIMRLILMIILTVIIGCSKEAASFDEQVVNCKQSLSGTSISGSDFEELKNNFSLWNCLNVNAYSFVNTQRMERCHGTSHRITVENGVIESIQLISSPRNDTIGCPFFTIDEIFNFLEEALDPEIAVNNITNRQGDSIYIAYQVDVDFDPAYGFPVLGKIDYVEAADEEFVFEISDFVPIDMN